MSALSRRKGRDAQAALAKRWRDSNLWPSARSSQGEQTRNGRHYAQLSADIEGTPFWVEHKHRKACRPMQALEQAEQESERASDWRPAIAVVRPPGVGLESLEECVVVMRLRDFEALCRSVDVVVTREAAE